VTTKNRREVESECEVWGRDRVQRHLDEHPDDPERLSRLEWLNTKLRETYDRQWAEISPDVQRALKASWANAMPPLASALYARWWQLESWLRSLLYVELKAALGTAWAEVLPKASESRQLGEREFRYMATPDAQNRLAYADASTLFNVTLERWEQFEECLLAKNVWTGRVEELRAIRNRIGHCRRPHSDDLVRLEQTLRDLEGGAFAAASSFNDQYKAHDNWTDAVTDGWVRNRHDTAVRLVEHAERQYETIFELRFSRRPWAKLPSPLSTIAGIPGCVWHAFWYFRGGRSFRLDAFWRRIEALRDLILLVCADDASSVQVSFAAVDDPDNIADAIGYCFDAALSSLGSRSQREDYSRWQTRYAELDPQVHVWTPWSLIEKDMRGTAIFAA
jgi:hypothetical protein